MKEILIFVIAIALSLLWIILPAQFIARLFRIPVRIAFWNTDKKNLHLTRPQFVWARGVIGFGIGMFLYLFGLTLMENRILGKQHDLLMCFLGDLIMCFILGIVWGYAAYRYCPSRTAPSPITTSDLSSKQ